MFTWSLYYLTLSAFSFLAMKEDRRAEDRTVAVAAVPKKTIPPGSLMGRQTSPRNLAPKKLPPYASMAGAKPAIKKLPSGFKGTIPKRPWPSATPSGTSARQAGPTPVTAASKKLPGSAAVVGVIRKPMSANASAASPAPGRLGPVSSAPSQPNSQIRQNIRRSLKEILWKRWAVIHVIHFADTALMIVFWISLLGKCPLVYVIPLFILFRVNDSDDLIMTENEVGKIALHIEKEMFNLFQVTDNRYKSKYRSIMFNLKDPKNQVCVPPTKCWDFLTQNRALPSFLLASQ